MTTPQITIVNCVTGDIVARDMNETELAQYEADALQRDKDIKAKIKTDQTAANKRQIILDRLGITNDELLTILS
jgi:hypothetical protein